MRVHCIIGVWIVVMCLSFCNATYAYECEGGRLDADADWDTVGDGAASASHFPVAEANASGGVSGSETNSGGAGVAYEDWVVYITNYDAQQDPTLTAYVTGMCEATVIARYDLEDSDYQAMAGSSGYGAGYSCSTFVSINEPDDGDIDTDWFETYVDVSYSGATIYFGHTAWADAEAFSTTATRVSVCAGSWSQTSALVDED